VELELEQLLELSSVQLEQQLVLLLNHKHLNHNQRQHIRRSNHQQFRNHNFAKPAQLHGEHVGRSQPEHMSELTQRMGCSSTCYGGPGHQFHQQLLGELVRPCHSDRRRKRS